MFHCSEIYDITTSYDPVKKDTACPWAGGSWWLDNDIVVRISKVCQRRYKREKTAENKEDVHAERFSSRLWLMRALSTLWRWRAAKSFLLCFLSIKDHLTLRIFVIVAITCKLKSTVVCRVGKCHGYDGYIRVKMFAGWGKSLGEDEILPNPAFLERFTHLCKLSV